MPSIYNIQIAFHDKNNHDLVPNFANVLKGNSLIGDVYIQRIPIDKVDTSSEESINKFLLDLYQTKVSIIEQDLKQILKCSNSPGRPDGISQEKCQVSRRIKRTAKKTDATVQLDVLVPGRRVGTCLVDESGYRLVGHSASNTSFW